MNSKQLIDPSATVAKLMKIGAPSDTVIEGLYLTALSRRPTSDEVERARTYFAGEGNRAARYGELLWRS